MKLPPCDLLRRGGLRGWASPTDIASRCDGTGARRAANNADNTRTHLHAVGQRDAAAKPWPGSSVALAPIAMEDQKGCHHSVRLRLCRTQTRVSH